MSAYPQSTIDELQENGAIVSKDGSVFYKKSYLTDEKEGINQTNILEKLGTTKAGNKVLKDMGIELKKMYPKPVELIKHLIQMCELPEDAIILDFFAGTGTTGHAVLDINKAQNKNYKFILCTNNESNICSDVLYARIRNHIYGYCFYEKGETVNINPLRGSVSYYKVLFFNTETKFNNEYELLNNTKVQEVYVKYVDEIISIKEDIQDYETNINSDNYTIFKKPGKQVVIIKQQIFLDISILSEIKRQLNEADETNVYYFFPNFEDSDQDYESCDNFKNEIEKHLTVSNIHSIPKEYIRKMINGDFEL